MRVQHQSKAHRRAIEVHIKEMNNALQVWGRTEMLVVYLDNPPPQRKTIVALKPRNITHAAPN